MTTIQPLLTMPEAVSGVQLAQGLGVQPARGFWTDAWSQVMSRRAARFALGWISVIAFFAVFAPWIASGHPITLRELDASGAVTRTTHPILEHVRGPDILLPLAALIGVPWIFSARRGTRARRLGDVAFALVLGGLIVVLSSATAGMGTGRNLTGLSLWVRDAAAARLVVPLTIAVLVGGIGLCIPAAPFGRRIGIVIAALLVGAFSASAGWERNLSVFDYIDRESRAEIRASYTLIPFSPAQRFTAADRQPPGATLQTAIGLDRVSPAADRKFLFGTDGLGQDVLANLLHACRLAISIGLVSTGIAVVIGVTMGALMGYFGGWVDMVLFRVVEIFMAVPLLFLLIVAAAVLPPELRTTYTMMAIIGLFTWTSAARFTRAEFLRLRSQDFVQANRAVGLSLPSQLFRHMLPNGVTPVLVDASFSIAAAISIEATLSYLGLGPVDQASWGKLLSSAMNTEGQFKWWLAVFPGFAIFLTVLSYNLIGEALRDAIDPKLKKARV
jgi:ABC-type dipeptide/oligopeptide/nickel transport system permease subunit